METDTKSLMKRVVDESDQMVLWTDEKKREFVGTFEDRVKVSQYILSQTAENVKQLAQDRQFISNKYNHKFKKYNQYVYMDERHGYKVAGRSCQELDEIADDQAKEIIRTLPPLKKAVEIISPDVSKMITNKEQMETKGQKFLDALKEVGGDLDLDDLDQSMTIKAFRQYVKTREKKRKALVNKLNELGEELAELDAKISKRLYAGIPGLSDAVVKAIVSCQEKATAMGELGRRVKEKVMFGDSEAALEILQTFEKDEAEVSADVKAELMGAIKALKLKGKVSKVKAKK